MAILLAFFVAIALSALGGVFCVKRALRRRTDKRQKLFSIAAGNLEGVKLNVPPLPITQYKKKQKRRLFQRPSWMSGWEDDENQPKREQRAHLKLLPEKVDRLLKARAAMYETHASVELALRNLNSVASADPGRLLAEPKFGKWWSEATQLFKNKRSFPRDYQRLHGIFAEVMTDIERRVAELKKLNALVVEKDVSFLNDEAFLALESATRIINELDLRQPNWPVPSDFPAEPEELDAEAEELCAQLPELVQSLVAATHKMSRFGSELTDLRNRIALARGGDIQLHEPRRPVEQEVQLFVHSALQWAELAPTLEAELPAAIEALRQAKIDAYLAHGQVTEILNRLNAFEQVSKIIYEDELPPPKEKPMDKHPVVDALAERLHSLESKLSSGAQPVELGKVTPFQPAKFQPGSFTAPKQKAPPKPVVEPPYETPKPPRVRRRFFITDGAQAIREAAMLVAPACENEVMWLVSRDHENDLRTTEQTEQQVSQDQLEAPEEMPEVQPVSHPQDLIEQQEKEAEMRAAIVSCLRKIGFAVGQLNAATDKREAHKRWQPANIPEPSLDVQDMNVLVQAVSSWHMQLEKQGAEKRAHEDQDTALAEQINMRRGQLNEATRSAAETLKLNKLLGNPPDSVAQPARALTLTARKYTPWCI